MTEHPKDEMTVLTLLKSLLFSWSFLIPSIKSKMKQMERNHLRHSMTGKILIWKELGSRGRSVEENVTCVYQREQFIRVLLMWFCCASSHQIYIHKIHLWSSYAAALKQTSRLNWANSFGCPRWYKSAQTIFGDPQTNSRLWAPLSSQGRIRAH